MYALSLLNAKSCTCQFVVFKRLETFIRLEIKQLGTSLFVAVISGCGNSDSNTDSGAGGSDTDSSTDKSQRVRARFFGSRLNRGGSRGETRRRGEHLKRLLEIEVIVKCDAPLDQSGRAPRLGMGWRSRKMQG